MIRNLDRRHRHLFANLKTRILFAAALAMFAALSSGQALADEPLSPPESYVREAAGGEFIVSSSVERNETRIYRKTSGPASGWTVTGWYRDVRVSKYGNSALLLTDNAPLASSDDGQTPIFIFAKKGEEPKPITLVALATGKMPRTQSHWLVYDRIDQAQYGWLIRLPGGKARVISWSNGAVDYRPSPRDLYEPGRQGFDHFFTEARAQLKAGKCVTYRIFFEHSYSRNSVSDTRFGYFYGARYPIPELPAAFMDGCVYAVPDEQIDMITVYHKDAGPQQPLDPVYDSPYFDAYGPLYGIIPIKALGRNEVAGKTDDVGTISLTVNRSPGVGTREAVLEKYWAAPVADPYDRGNNSAIWRNLSLSSNRYDAAALVDMLRTLKGRWAGDAKDWKNTAKKNSFAQLPEGTSYLEETGGAYGPQTVMIEKQGSQITGQIFLWRSDAPYLCFSGRLDRDQMSVAGRSVIMGSTSPSVQTVKKDAVITLDKLGPLRPPPPEKIEEIEEYWNPQESMAGCRKALGL